MHRGEIARHFEVLLMIIYHKLCNMYYRPAWANNFRTNQVHQFFLKPDQFSPKNVVKKRPGPA